MARIRNADEFDSGVVKASKSVILEIRYNFKGLL